jgi:hypothetical protein
VPAVSVEKGKGRRWEEEKEGLDPALIFRKGRITLHKWGLVFSTI